MTTEKNSTNDPGTDSDDSNTDSLVEEGLASNNFSEVSEVDDENPSEKIETQQDQEGLWEPTTGDEQETNANSAESEANLDKEALLTQPSQTQNNNAEQGQQQDKTTQNSGSKEILEDELSNTQPPKKADSFLARRSWPNAEKFGDEESLLKAANPSKYAYLKQYLFGIGASVVGTILLIHYAFTGVTGPITQSPEPFGVTLPMPNLYVTQLVILTLAGIGHTLYHHTNRKHTWYLLTDQRVWVRKGILSRRDKGNLDHQNITNIEEANPYPERLFGIGNVKIFTPSSDGEEAVLTGLKRPSEWVSIIRSQVQDTQKTEQQPNNT